MPYVFLAFVAVPIIEIALFMQIGSAIGTWNTIAIVILTAVLGTWLLRQQGMATLMNAQMRLQSGEMPASAIMEGLLLLVGGVLLLTPGFMTDAVGFFCLIPVSRRFLANLISKRAGAMVWTNIGSQSGQGFPGQPGVRPENTSPGASESKNSGSARRVNGDVIEGEYRREDKK